MKHIFTTASMAALLLAAPAWAQQTSQGGPLDTQGGQLNTQDGQLQTQGGQLNTQGQRQAPHRAGQLNAQDQQFLKEAGQGNVAEVQLGQLASQRAQHESVKEFGRWMASAHGFANRELATITERMHGQAPQPTLPPDAQATMQKLQSLSGAQFDQAYLQAMVQDHQKDIPKFQQEARNGKDYLVKTFAQNIVPALQEHLREAQDLQQDISNSPQQGAGPAANAAVQGTAGSTQPTTMSK